MKFFKLLFVFLGLAATFLFFAPSSIAKTSSVVVKASPTPTPVAEVNPFELFWPLAPGKVMGDSLYSLKVLKEKVRGFFIFGSPQKADYKVFLATKRLIEAGQLLNDGKSDLANKTLDSFLGNIDASFFIWDKTKGEGNTPVPVKDNIRKELGNLDIYLKSLSLKNQGDIKSKVDQGLDKVSKYLNSL